MLRFFRGGGAAQLVVGGIVSAIIIVFAVEFRAGRGPTAGLKRQCAVEYDGSCVDQKEYFAAFGVTVPRGLDGAAAKRLGLRKRVLEGLVERELLVSTARNLGLGVGQETIDAELEAGRAHVSLPAAEAGELSARLGLCRIDRAGAGCEPGAEQMVRQLRVRRTPSEPFDYKLYEREIRVLANRGPKEFKVMQERELLAERLRDLVRARVRVSAAEAEIVAERAVIRSVDLSRDWFAKYVIDMAPVVVDRWAFDNRAQVDAAWESEKSNYTAGCPLIREVVIPVPAEALEDEKSPSKQKAEQARSRLAAGEDFGTVARELSSGPSSLVSGEVGCLSKSYGLGADELMKAVESLKPGELSKVIETPRGYHVVKLLERLDPGKTEEVGRHRIAQNLYAHFAADEAARKFAENLIDRTKSGQKLEDAVRELTASVIRPSAPAKNKPKAGEPPRDPPALTAEDRPRFEISPPFGRSGNPLPNLEPKEPVAAKAFELGKPDALNDKPIETSTGYLVFQVKELTRPDPTEVAEVRATMRSLKADDALARYVAELRHKAGTKLKIDQSFGEDRTQTSSNEE